MMVEIEHSDGSRTALFGVSDFNNSADDTVEVYFDQNTGRDTPMELTGDVRTAIREFRWTVGDAADNIANLAAGEDGVVLVGVTDTYPKTKQALSELQADPDVALGDDVQTIGMDTDGEESNSDTGTSEMEADQ